MSLQNYLLRRHPAVIGVPLIIFGAWIMASPFLDARSFHSFENAKGVKGKVLSVQTYNSDLDVSVSWPEREKDTSSVTREPGGKRAATAGKRKPAAPEAQPEPLPEVTILHPPPKVRIVVRRNGTPTPTQADALQEGDVVDLLVSPKDQSVILAALRPREVGGAQMATMMLLGGAFFVVGAALVAFRRAISAGAV